LVSSIAFCEVPNLLLLYTNVKLYRMLEPRFTVNKLDLIVRVSEFSIKKDFLSKYYNLSNTEFVNFTLPSLVSLQLLFSLGKFCLQPLNIGIVALNPTRGTEVGPGFSGVVLSCLARKPETGRSPVKVS